jgi:polygalacturonase
MKQLFFLCFLVLLTHSFIQAKDYNIINFGAVSDAKTLNTEFIQKAINQASQDGGGRVIIPQGRFLSGSIILKSGVELHLEKKAVLLGSTDPEQYKSITRWKALVLANDALDIAVSGKGTIDGQGARLALNIDSLFYEGKVDSSDYSIKERRPREYIRPQILEFINCRDISISGITFKNSASWVQTYEICRNLTIDKIRVESDAYWNNDGIDVIDCRNVRITNSYINSADDGICLKSEEWDLTEYCDSIYIASCTIRSSASAIKFGTASVSAIKNVVIKNIMVFNTYRSAIAIEAVQGAVIENILIENILAKNTGNAIFLRIGKIRNAKRPGSIKNVTIRNVKVTVPFEHPDYAYSIRGPELPYFHNVFPSSITGIPEFNIENVTLEFIKIVYPGRGNRAYANLPLSRLDDVPELVNHYPEFSMFGELPSWGFYVRHVDGLTMKNIKLKIKDPDYRPALVFDDAKNLTLKNVIIKGDKKTNPIILKDVENESLIR